MSTVKLEYGLYSVANTGVLSSFYWISKKKAHIIYTALKNAVTFDSLSTHY